MAERFYSIAYPHENASGGVSLSVAEGDRVVWQRDQGVNPVAGRKRHEPIRFSSGRNCKASETQL